MFITKTKHEAALAERDATIEGLMVRIDRAKSIIENHWRREKIDRHKKYALEDEIDALRTRLAPFTTYTRGAGGRFVKKPIG